MRTYLIENKGALDGRKKAKLLETVYKSEKGNEFRSGIVYAMEMRKTVK